MENTCLFCHHHFTKRTRHLKKFCDSRCRSKHYNARTAQGARILDRSSRGAVSEMLVAADLLEKDFHVFSAVSPHCPVDLVALKNGELFKVEVKTGRRAVSGAISHPSPQNTYYDVLAVALPDGIVYRSKTARFSF